MLLSGWVLHRGDHLVVVSQLLVVLVFGGAPSLTVEPGAHRRLLPGLACSHAVRLAHYVVALA